MAPRIRLDPADEYLHENTGESNFNESMYFNFFDAAQRLGGFARIGNRPNERYAETTICLYEPDGAVLFNFKRAEIADNARLFALDIPPALWRTLRDEGCIDAAARRRASAPGQNAASRRQCPSIGHQTVSCRQIRGRACLVPAVAANLWPGRKAPPAASGRHRGRRPRGPSA